MSVQYTNGVFNPAQDIVLVAGDWDWDTATAPQLTNNGAQCLEQTVHLTNSPGNVINYKFLFLPFAGGEVWESDGVGAGGTQNRQVAFPNGLTNLPVVYFNNIAPTSPRPW